MNKFNFKHPALLLLVAMAGILILALFPQPVHAAWDPCDWWGYKLLAPGDCLAKVATSIGNWSDFFTNPMGFMLQILATFVVQFLGDLISSFGSLLDMFVNLSYTTFNIPIINSMWAIFKNFINLFFVLIMIIIAFATIFDNPKYNYKGLLLHLIIVALIINFSLLIGQTIISVSDFLSHVFLVQIQANGTDLSKTIMQGFSVHKIQLSAGSSGIANILGDQSEILRLLILLCFLLIFMLVILFTFIIAAMMVMIRIPILWALLIVSPLAWFGWILPQTKNLWHTWWKHFLDWTFFLPFYLFILMFGVGFINFQTNNPDKLNLDQGLTTANMLKGFGITDIFFFLVTLFFLAGGLYIAKRSSLFAGSEAVKRAGSISAALQYIPNKARAWSSTAIKRAPIPGTGGQSYASLKKATLGTLGTIKEQGLPGGLGKFYGGDREFRRATSAAQDRMQRALGYKPSYAAQSEFLSRANDEYKSIKQQVDLGQLDTTAIRGRATTADVTNAEGFAYIKAAAEAGAWDDAVFNTAINSLSDNPTAAGDLVDAASKSNFAGISDASITAMAASINTAVPARKKLYKHLQSNDRLLASPLFNQARFDDAIALFGGETTTEGAAFMRDVGNVRPELVITHNVSRPATATFTPPPGTIAGYIDAFYTAISRKGASDVAKISRSAMTYMPTPPPGTPAPPPGTPTPFISALTRLLREKQASSPMNGGYPGGGEQFRRELVNTIYDRGQKALISAITIP